MARLATLPGVAAVGATSVPPGDFSNAGTGGHFIDRIPEQRDRGREPETVMTIVAPGSFAAFGIPLKSGRDFNDGDSADRPLVAIVNETLVRTSLAGQDPIGRTIYCLFDRSDPMTIVGVVGDVRNGAAQTGVEPMLYVPMTQSPWEGQTFLLRTAANPATLVRPVQRELSAIDPGLPVNRVSTLESLLADGLSTRRLPVVLIGGFAALALLLASVGVYAMFASMTAAREREFGVRMALGSSRLAIAALVVRQGSIWMALGLAGGALGIVGVARLVRTMLYGIAPFDAVTLAVAVTLLLACAVVAVVGPVRRATRADPVVLLR
jgi:hypothetical protein